MAKGVDCSLSAVSKIGVTVKEMGCLVKESILDVCKKHQSSRIENSK